MHPPASRVDIYIYVHILDRPDICTSKVSYPILPYPPARIHLPRLASPRRTYQIFLSSLLTYLLYLLN